MLVQTSLTVLDKMPLPRLCDSDPIPNDVHPSDHVPICFTLEMPRHTATAESVARLWLNAILDTHPTLRKGFARKQVMPLTRFDLRNGKPPPARVRGLFSALH
jgi:hypothetical protein